MTQYNIKIVSKLDACGETETIGSGGGTGYQLMKYQCRIECHHQQLYHFAAPCSSGQNRRYSAMVIGGGARYVLGIVSSDLEKQP
jgi:hypothetical protein